MVYLVPTQYFLIQLQLINHYFNSLTERKKGQQQKKYNHAQQHHNFRVFHSLSKFVRSLLAAIQDLFLTIVERDHVFNLRAAEKDLFLLGWLQDLPAEACKSGQIHLSCSAEVIPEMLSTMSSSSICFKKSQLSGDSRTLIKKTPLFLRKLHHLVDHNRLEAYHSDIGSKRTNHKFGCFSEVHQSNILIPSKIPFIRKCVFLNSIFFSKVGGPGPPQPLPLHGP